MKRIECNNMSKNDKSTQNNNEIKTKLKVGLELKPNVTTKAEAKCKNLN